MNIDWEKVFKYINEELSVEEKTEYEKEIISNQHLKEVFDDLNNNDVLLKNISKISTSSDFVYRVNNMIDQYESKRFSWYHRLSEKLTAFDTVPLFGALSLILIISFTTYKISTNNNFNSFNRDSKLFVNDVVASNEDSLINSPDSLNLDSNLMLGNDR